VAALAEPVFDEEEAVIAEVEEDVTEEVVWCEEVDADAEEKVGGSRWSDSEEEAFGKSVMCTFSSLQSLGKTMSVL